MVLGKVTPNRINFQDAVKIVLRFWKNKLPSTQATLLGYHYHFWLSAWDVHLFFLVLSILPSVCHPLSWDNLSSQNTDRLSDNKHVLCKMLLLLFVDLK